MNHDKQVQKEKQLLEEIYQNEKKLDQLVKDLYNNRIEKREIIIKLYTVQNPNLDETQKIKQKKTKIKQTDNNLQSK